jgi:hypothetical protein
LSDPDKPPPSVEVSGELTEAAVEAAPAESMSSPPGSSEALPYPNPPADEPILPASADLQDAVGVPTKRRREPEPDAEEVERKWSRRTTMIAGGTLIAGIGIVALVFLGRANAQRYLMTCSTDRVTPEQGRAFPPWGSRPLAGPEWKPVALPPNAECTEHETDDIGELERLYLGVLVDRASTTLTGKNLLEPTGKNAPAPLDTAAEQLNQALLLARSPQSRDQRKEVERLLGDVQYWRATARLRDANAALADAAKQFEAASAARPRHVTDAGEWAGFLRKLVDELHAGPGGETPVLAPIAPTAPSSVPQGSALPVEQPEAPSAPPVDAGLPTGGVLL